MHYILVDLENIHPSNFGDSDPAKTKVVVFIGAKQTRVKECTQDALDAGGFDAEYVRISGTGPNALDFHIAYYIGKISSKNPNASFQVLSRDTGFDPLIAHLNTKNIRASRECELCLEAPRKAVKIEQVVECSENSVPEHLIALIKSLWRISQTLPKKAGTLANYIRDSMNISIKDAKRVMKQMLSLGYVVLSTSSNRVSYRLPDAKFCS